MSDIHDEREQKFRELLIRIQKSPLYGKKLASVNTSGIGLADIGKLPLTTKAELRNAGAFGHLAVEMREIAQYHESFGTTGEPSASWFTAEDFANGGRQMRECGVDLTADDLLLIRFPYSMSLPAFLMQNASWQAGAGVVPASSRTPVTPYPRVLELMKRLGVTVIAGLPREMELLAETARLSGMDPSRDFPALRALCIAGELTSERRRAHIGNLWGCAVFNLFGSTETGNVAAMCKHGAMHIVERDFVVEVLCEDGVSPVANGKRGFAAITTLSHRASPLLRYFNEDVVSVESGLCACGRSGSRLVHYGRRKDRTVLGDVVLDGYDMQEAVYALQPPPDAWQAVERENGFHFILDSHRSAEWTEEMLRAQLSAMLHVPVTVEIDTSDALLNRENLLHNTPSKKPVYIQRLDRKEDPLVELLDKGRAQLLAHNPGEAMVLFQQAADMAPESAEAHAWLAGAYGRLIEAGDMLEKIKLLPLLEHEIATALSLDPAHPFARRMNGARLLHTPETLGGSPAEAADEFRYCISRGLDSADVWAALGECYAKLGNNSEAIKMLEEALAREPGQTQAMQLRLELENDG